MANRDHPHHRRGKHSSKRQYPVPEPVQNKFVNDGSFLEQMKKMLAQQTKTSAPANATNASNAPTSSTATSSTVLPGGSSTYPAPAPSSSSSSSSQKDPVSTFSSITGKRRGPPTLKTGMVKKIKKEEAEEPPSTDNKDPWSKYLEEVKRIKEQLCIEGEENRPLVK